MIKITFTPHASKRLRQRNISQTVVEDLFRKIGRILHGKHVYVSENVTVVGQRIGDNSVRIITTWNTREAKNVRTRIHG